MSELQIEIASAARDDDDAAQKIAIRARDVVLTALLRPGANAPDEYVEAPPAQLAFWLVDNWWRLRWECIPSSGMSSDWLLAHNMSDVGGGYAWPHVVFWGEGERIGLAAQSDPVGVVGPVRYTTDALMFISAREFETEIDRYLSQVSDERSGFGSDRDALRAQVEALQEERNDPAISQWRQLEASLGFDADAAPEELMNAFSRFQEEYGFGGVAEAAQAVQGVQALTVLEEELARAEHHHWQCDLNRSAKLVTVKRGANLAPWETAEDAARQLRKAANYGPGPLTNQQLADLLHVKVRALHNVEPSDSTRLTYGLRLNTGRKRGEVVALSSRWSNDRRFEFSRALADAIWSRSERLGPLTRAKTERQKFQRAFAQSLLCPYKDLRAYVGTDNPLDEDLSAAAKHFRVSERVVRTVLVNKKTIERGRLWRLRDRDVAENLEDLVEAA